MLIGREQELAQLVHAIHARRSLLVHGAAGTGKTALLEEALSSLPPRIRRMCLVCTSCENPRTIWRCLVRSLAKIEDPRVLSYVRRECAGTAKVEHWLSKQSSLRLRGILRRAMLGNAYWVFLDAAAPLPDGVHNLLQDWVWSRRTPVILLGRGLTEKELGRVAKLFWHSGMRLELLRMPTLDLEELLEFSIVRFGLSRVASADFRDFVLKRAGGLPGRIVGLCELASQSVYPCPGHVKLHTLAVDFLMQHTAGAPRFQGANPNA